MTRRRATRTARPLRWRASWWPTWLLWIGAKKSFYQYKEKTAPPLARCRKYQEDFFSARQLPTGRRSVSSRCPHRIVSRLAAAQTQSSVKTTRWPETANGCLGSTSKRNHCREARKRAEEPEGFLSRASPKRVRRAFALLTRTYHGCRQSGNWRITSVWPVVREQSDCWLAKTNSIIHARSPPSLTGTA